MHNQQLKLIALLLPEPFSDGVKQEQLLIAEKWGPKHALQTPPHITIIPPLSVTPAENEKLWSIADKIATYTSSFDLTLDGFGWFKPKVIYIKPIEIPALENLYQIWRKEILEEMPHLLKQYPDRPYHPHVTLAHRDMDPTQYKVLQEYYSGKKFFAEIEIKNFYILKHHPGGWEKEIAFYFNNTKP